MYSMIMNFRSTLLLGILTSLPPSFSSSREAMLLSRSGFLLIGSSGLFLILLGILTSPPLQSFHIISEEDMGEIDTKPFESVQASLSLFEEKNNDHRKNVSTGSEVGKGKELDLMLKYLANYKVQLEVKESAYMQTLLKLELYQKTVDELSIQLKNSEADRDKYFEECRQTRIQRDELEYKINKISDQLLETEKDQEQLLDAVSKLKAVEEEWLNTKAELAAAKELKLSAIEQAKLMETSINMEKEKNEKLLKHIAELNKAILHLKLVAVEVAKEKSTINSDKDAKIQMAMEAAVQVHEPLEKMRIQAYAATDLENQLLVKSQFIDSLQLDLKQPKEFHSSFTKVASVATNDLNQIKSGREMVGRENSDQEIYVESMETKLSQLELELKIAREEVHYLNHEIEMLKGEIQRAESEMEETRVREREAQVEIAMLKSELHKGRSKIAAAEAAEAMTKSIKSGFYLAVQQLAIEAEEAKKETKKLRRIVEVGEETGNSASVKLQFAEPSPCLRFPLESEIKEDKGNNIDTQITVPMNESKALIRKPEQVDQLILSPPEDASHVIVSKTGSEVDALENELEAAIAEIKELRSVAEKAVSRAELAEKAKVAVEDQLRKWREQKQRRAAAAALGDESSPKQINPSKCEKVTVTHQPLGKVLNLKF
ncbi:PREDICTED: protein WEAK CHLOROPLAST MOVEMENT UNDER BLUE LIGHT 1-like isoform X2 [Nelumbo nucifera]|uniref:Protein WEAK CHLOROPLAST MOVEMENT UNDER BLUE LIGHT 1-like isoform X2 n=2 Tax=Nelumbo nucifera TaxID=4432 RepID=A0A1U8A9H2_NELNU|nr:PREDICTED: protein WEAK CHLOROPLAST MOVEMENT UNDER BLUE LIGHT 1-like isoform X2 [Nelumbo nucifera]